MRVAVSVALAKRVGQVLTPELAIALAREICDIPDLSVAPGAAAVEVRGAYTYQVERLPDAYEELQAQRHAYLDECDPESPRNIDWERLLGLSRTGSLVIFTARDAASALVGSMWVWLTPSINSGRLSLTDDMLFVLPEHRKGWCAVWLWQYGERVAFGLGVREATVHSRLSNRTDRISRFCGYKLDAIRVKKSHNGDSFADVHTRHEGALK